MEHTSAPYLDARRMVMAIFLGLVFTSAAMTSSFAKPARNTAKLLGRHEVATPCAPYASGDRSPAAVASREARVTATNETLNVSLMSEAQRPFQARAKATPETVTAIPLQFHFGNLEPHPCEASD